MMEALNEVFVQFTFIVAVIGGGITVLAAVLYSLLMAWATTTEWVERRRKRRE